MKIEGQRRNRDGTFIDFKVERVADLVINLDDGRYIQIQDNVDGVSMQIKLK